MVKVDYTLFFLAFLSAILFIALIGEVARVSESNELKSTVSTQMSDILLLANGSQTNLSQIPLSSITAKIYNVTWLNFNGSGQTIIPDANQLSPSVSANKTTISFWVYMNNFSFKGQSSTAEYTNYFGKTAYSPNRCEYEFRMENSSGLDSPNYRPCRMSFYAFNSSCGLGAGANFQDNDTATSCNSLNNTWIFVTGRINGTNVAIFKNGILRNEALLSGYGIQLNNTSANLHIGADIDSGQWTGQMDNIRIYNSSLTQEEIAEIYRSGIKEDISSANLYNDTYLFFNGIDGYTETNIQVSNLTNESSFVGWFYRNNNNSANTIIGSSGSNEVLLQLATNHDIKFWANATGGGATFPNASTNGVWTNFAVVYNNSNGNATLYINGVINSSKILTGKYLITSNTLIFGQRANTANPFNGSLDNLLIFNKTLNSSDVLTIYNLGRIGKNTISNPLAEYSFNNSKFVTFIDTSTNSYNGTLYNEGVTFGNDGIVIGIRTFIINQNVVGQYRLNENQESTIYDLKMGNNGTIGLGVIYNNDNNNITLSSINDYTQSGINFMIININQAWNQIRIDYSYGLVSTFGFHVSILRLLQGFIALFIVIFIIFVIYKIYKDNIGGTK